MLVSEVMTEEGQRRRTQCLSTSAPPPMTKQRAPARYDRGEDAEKASECLIVRPRSLKYQMLDGAVGREWKSPNRGLLRVKQTEAGDA